MVTNINLVKIGMEQAKKIGYCDIHLNNRDDLRTIFDIVAHEGLEIDSLGNNDWVIYTISQLKEWENN